MILIDLERYSECVESMKYANNNWILLVKQFTNHSEYIQLALRTVLEQNLILILIWHNKIGEGHSLI